MKTALAIALLIALCGVFAAGPMKMDEPMRGEMKKEGMKKSDVRKSAQKKEREMKPRIEQERKTMR